MTIRDSNDLNLCYIIQLAYSIFFWGGVGVVPICHHTL